MGDWIVYLEPTKANLSRGYFAAAKVQKVITDAAQPNMYLAIIEPGSFLQFPNPVPFRGPDGVIETGVLNAEGRISGRAEAAVRPLSAADFNRIVGRGLDADESLLPRLGESPLSPGLRENQVPIYYELNRDRTTMLMSRAVRDRAFRQLVLKSYNSRCAVTV